MDPTGVKIHRHINIKGENHKVIKRCDIPSLKEYTGGDDFDDKRARIAQYVGELQGMTEIDGEDL